MLIYKDIEKRLLSCDHGEQNKQETTLETINPEQGCFSLWAVVIMETMKLFQQSGNKAVKRGRLFLWGMFKCGAAAVVGGCYTCSDCFV